MKTNKIRLYCRNNSSSRPTGIKMTVIHRGSIYDAKSAVTMCKTTLLVVAAVPSLARVNDRTLSA